MGGKPRRPIAKAIGSEIWSESERYARHMGELCTCGHVRGAHVYTFDRCLAGPVGKECRCARFTWRAGL